MGNSLMVWDVIPQALWAGERNSTVGSQGGGLAIHMDLWHIHPAHAQHGGHSGNGLAWAQGVLDHHLVFFWAYRDAQQAHLPIWLNGDAARHFELPGGGIW